MKLFNAIAAAAAVVGTVSVTAIPVFGQTAPNGWRQGGCFTSTSGCIYVKVVSKDYTFEPNAKKLIQVGKKKFVYLTLKQG